MNYKQRMDILFFIGQSNMQGSTGERDNSAPLDNAFEYKFLSNTAEKLHNPVGENIGYSILLPSASGNGSMLNQPIKENLINQ